MSARQPVPGGVSVAADYSNIPERLKALPRWTRFRYETRDGKKNKIPLDARTGRRASTTDSSTWMTFQNAVDSEHGDGLGFVLGAGIAGVDVDKCRDPKSGEIAPWASDLLSHFLRGTYAESSISGTGVHVLLEGRLKSGGRRRITYPPGNADGSQVEMYDESSPRFFIMTGTQVSESSEISNMQSELEALEGRVFGTSPSVDRQRDLTDAPAGHHGAALSDDELIEKARRAANGAKFDALWSGDTSGYGGDDSAADLALCNLIAFWSRDPAQVDRVFNRSGLCREKWLEQRGAVTYGQKTIARAIADCRDSYDPKRRPEPSMAPDPASQAPEQRTDDSDHTPEGAYSKKETTRLVHLGMDSDLFHAPDRQCYSRFKVGNHHETWPLDSEYFRDRLMYQYFRATGSAPRSQPLKDAIAQLGALALFNGREQKVLLRTARSGGEIFIDLGNDSWESVAVGPDGWRITSAPPVAFRRTSSMLPLPTPERGGSVDELRGVINAPDDDTFIPIISFIVAALRPEGPFPILGLTGEMGSGKTWLARIVRRLIDPSKADVRMAPREDRDVAVAASNSLVLAFDNLSAGLDRWLSDSICQLSTGAGYSKRLNYTDADEIVMSFARPVILNGIDDLGTRGDLSDRMLAVSLPAIPAATRRPEADIKLDTERVLPRVFGAILNALSAALRHLDNVQLTGYPRMADVAKWVTAAEHALPWGPGTFLKISGSGRSVANAAALESSPVSVACQKLLSPPRDQWEGTATELQKDLRRLHGDDGKNWPRNARALSNELRRQAPLLRDAGVDVSFQASRTKRVIKFQRIGAAGPIAMRDANTPVTQTATQNSEVCVAVQATENIDVSEPRDANDAKSLPLFKQKEEEGEGGIAGEARKKEEVSEICVFASRIVADPISPTTYDATQTATQKLAPASHSCGHPIVWRTCGSSHEAWACTDCYPPPLGGPEIEQMIAPGWEGAA